MFMEAVNTSFAALCESWPMMSSMCLCYMSQVSSQPQWMESISSPSSSAHCPHSLHPCLYTRTRRWLWAWPSGDPNTRAQRTGPMQSPCSWSRETRSTCVCGRTRGSTTAQPTSPPSVAPCSSACENDKVHFLDRNTMKSVYFFALFYVNAGPHKLSTSIFITVSVHQVEVKGCLMNKSKKEVLRFFPVVPISCSCRRRWFKYTLLDNAMY